MIDINRDCLRTSVGSLPMATMLDSQRELYRRIQAYELDDPSHELGFVRQLMRHQGWSRKQCLRTIEEYKKFVFLAAVADHQLVPSDAVDQVWHLHLLYSEPYWEDFCPNVLGRKLQHRPARGGRQERELFLRLYRATIESYRQFFAEPPLDLWPPADLRFASDPRMQRIHIGRRLSARIRLGSPFWRGPGLHLLLAGLGLLAVCAVASTPMALANSPTGSAPSATVDPPAMLLLLPAMAVGLVIRRLIRRPDPQTTVPLLSAEQLAYLARGVTGALDVALAQLVDRGALQPNRQTKTLNLTIYSSSWASLLEQQLIERAKQLARALNDTPSYVNLVTPGAYDCSALKRDLRRMGLMIGPLARAASLSFYVLLIPLIVCIPMSVALPLSREFRHAFASVLVTPWTLALVCSVFLIIPGGRTRWGSSLLRQHKKLGDAHDPMMRVALLGPMALKGARLDDLRLFIIETQQDLSGSGGGGGCGGGCGGC